MEPARIELPTSCLQSEPTHSRFTANVSESTQLIGREGVGGLPGEGSESSVEVVDKGAVGRVLGVD